MRKRKKLIGICAVIATALCAIGGVTTQKNIQASGAYYEFVSESNNTQALSAASCEYVDSFEMAPNADISGVRVKIPMGTTWMVNDVFNVKKLNKEEPFITIYPYNNTCLLGRNGNTVEACNIHVKLTDVNDPNNFIVFEYHWNAKNEYRVEDYNYAPLWYRAGTNGSQMWSVEQASVPTGHPSLVRDGVTYYRTYKWYGVGAYDARTDYYRDANGKKLKTPTEATVRSEGTYGGSYGFSFYYDDAKKAVYADDVYGYGRIVSFLDAPEIYGEQAFKGFTTGEVYLSISADGYNSSNTYAPITPEVNFEISRLFDKTGEALNLSEEVADVNTPYITWNGTSENSVLYVAKDEKIFVPTATVYDKNFKGYKTEIYYMYGTERQSLVGYNGSTFTPNRIGEYTVLITAEDAFNNISTSKVTLKSVKCENDSIMDFSVEEINSPKAGEMITLPEPTIISKNGSVNVKSLYAKGDGEFIETDESNSFFVDGVGEYTIRYDYGDMLVNYQYEYTLQSVPSDIVKFEKEVLPTYFIKDAKYTLDDVIAYTYQEKDEKANVANVYVSEDGGEYYQINAKNYQVKAERIVQFKYEWNGVTQYSDVIKAVDVGFKSGLRKADYFQGSNFTNASSFDEITYTSENAGDNVLEFINAISLSSFVFEFSIPEDLADFTRISIELIDYYNRENIIRIGLRRNEGDEYPTRWNYSGDKGNWAYCKKTFTDASPFRFLYEAGAIRDTENNVRKLNQEFTSDKILLRVLLEGATGKSGISIKCINNTSFDKYSFDEFKPIIKDTNVYPLSVPYGENITVTPATVTDVLTPYLEQNLKFYVVDPDGEYVKTIDNILLDQNSDVTKTYTFKLEQYGAYWVYYEYIDQKGIVQKGGYPLRVDEKNAPTLILGDKYGETTVVSALKDTKVPLATYQVMDDTTEEIYVNVIAISPLGEQFAIKESYFIPRVKGNWKIMYYCYDENGNTTTRYYTISVS